jgi:hypothetical protein
MFSELKDGEAAAHQKEEVEILADLAEPAGGLARLHGEASLRLSGLG